MIIVITRPGFFEGEAAGIAEMLHGGRADLVHIRKPDADLKAVEQLIRELPHDVYSRLVLHDHYTLARQYGLRGIHLNSRHPEPPDDWAGPVSVSCHSLQELAEQKQKPFIYLSLSPIFDSISKPGYTSAFTPDQLAEAHRQGIIDLRVMALGGVTFDKMPLVRRMGFGGGMILGDAWKDE